jgi:hypothetical protein
MGLEASNDKAEPKAFKPTEQTHATPTLTEMSAHQGQANAKSAVAEREYAMYGKPGEGFTFAKFGYPYDTHNGGYAEQQADAANTQKKPENWNPNKGLLNPIEPSSWTKLQQYSGDVGRANGWNSNNFRETNALRHALSSAYITHNFGAPSAIAAGDFHEIQTGVLEMNKGLDKSKDPKDIQTWKDHDVDNHNNYAGAKIAQEIASKGGSWTDIERAVVEAVKKVGADGKIQQPNGTLHTFLY